MVQLQESLRRKEKQWDKERLMLDADKLAAETDARQKDDVIRSKDQLIAQKNELVAEKDAALRDRLEALQQKVHFLAYLFSWPRELEKLALFEHRGQADRVTVLASPNLNPNP